MHTLGSTEKGKGLSWGLCLWEGQSGKVRNDQVRIRGGLEASPEGRGELCALLAVIGPQAQRPRVVMLASALPPRGRVYLHTHNHAALSGGPPAREGALDAAGRTPGSSALGRRCPGPCATRGLAREDEARRQVKATECWWAQAVSDGVSGGPGNGSSVTLLINPLVA